MRRKIVKTQYGMVMGVPADREDVILYKGIPIGADTALENRFCEPQPAVCWEDVYMCDHWPDRFLQEPHAEESFWKEEFHGDIEYEPGNSENGLAVNLYAPIESEEKLPVFVYIHGGGFMTGYASEEEFNASNLAANGVIVVLLQYRLGALGWLALPELSAQSKRGVSGNYAVLDMIFGLRWVKDNIAAFGGDPEKVTIAGQSAGAMSVTCLLRSPLAKGLFQKVIIQSGFNGFLNMPGLGNDFRPIRDAEKQNEEALAEIFGRKMTLADLRAIPTADLLKPGPHEKKDAEGNQMSLFMEMSLAVGQMVMDGYVFTEESIDLLRKENLEGIQIMMGGTTDEATTLIGDYLYTLDITPGNAEEKMRQRFGDGSEKFYELASKADAEISFMRAISDRCFQKYLLTAKMAGKENDCKIYVYRFAQVPPGRNAEFRGAYHSSDLWYMFNSMRRKENQRNWAEKDYQMANVMSKYWMNFVKYGDPNGAGLIRWDPCREEDGLCFLELKDGIASMRMDTGQKERDLYYRRWLMRYC